MFNEQVLRATAEIGKLPVGEENHYAIRTIVDRVFRAGMNEGIEVAKATIKGVLDELQK